MDRRISSERGQVLVLLTLAIVVLLGFTALAVDGGMVYSDRRHAQSGSDASSLAGGGAAALYLDNHQVTYSNWDCDDAAVIAAQNSQSTSEPGAKKAAIARAADNNYTIDTDINDNHGVTTACGEVSHGGWIDKYIDTRTLVTRDTQTSFAHFIFGGLLRNSVEAVTRIRPRTSLAFGHAIVALNDADCSGHTNGVTFNGGSVTLVNGGGVFSNGCLRANGGADIDVTNGSVNYGSQVAGNGGQFSPAPAPTDPLPSSVMMVPPPNCSDPRAWNGTGPQLKALLMPLAPGLYCISGDLHINGGDSLIGNRITLAIMTGALTINGNALVQISAAPTLPDPAPALPGMLIYVPESNHNDIQLAGTADSFFYGTIYAPGSNIDMTGTAGTTANHTQVIGWNVQAGGTADTDVTFNEAEQYSQPPTLELYK